MLQNGPWNERTDLIRTKTQDRTILIAENAKSLDVTGPTRSHSSPNQNYLTFIVFPLAAATTADCPERNYTPLNGH